MATKKPTYKDVAPLLFKLGVKEKFVDKEKPAPKPPKPPRPELTKKQAEEALEELKTDPCYSKVAKKVGATPTQVAEIDKEAKATWALKTKGIEIEPTLEDGGKIKKV